MADSIRHRGPDSSGVWCDGEAGIAFGHRRLAVVDLSEHGHQPMVSGDGRYIITYNGEVYNFPDLRRELLKLGHRFQGHGDTEAVLAAIVEWGLPAAVSRFVGMFAFALWDREKRELHLVRDRLGIKPLYYAELDGKVLFASELTALRQHPDFRSEIDRDGLTLLLKRGSIPAPFSVFQRVSKLLPATIMTFTAGGGHSTQRTFWSLRDIIERGQAVPFDGSAKEAEEELERLLREAIRQRMIADVPLGVFLSGGVDSSTVAALAQQVADDRVKTYSIGFDNADYDEGEDAALVAGHLGTDHHALHLSEADALAAAPGIAAKFDEPFADSSQIPTYLVSKMARRDVTVVLSGDGGDEFFGGYNRYLWVEKLARRFASVPRPLRTGLARALTSISPDRLDRFGGLLRQRTTGDKLHKLATVMGARDGPEIYRRLLCHWPDAAGVVVGGSDPADLPERPGEWAALPDFTSQMMYLDAMGYLPDDILTKVDRASMAVSLEARVPLIDHRVVEFAWRLPRAMKVQDGTGKLPLRRILYKYVPRELIERPKMGFAVPIHEWLRGPLRDWAEELLSEDRLKTEGYFEPAPIRRVWREHLDGQRNRQHQLWCVLSFQAWLAGQEL